VLDGRADGVVKVAAQVGTTLTTKAAPTDWANRRRLKREGVRAGMAGSFITKQP
jgi:hypothetical protein